MDEGDSDARNSLATLAFVLAIFAGFVGFARSRHAPAVVGRVAPEFSLSLVANGGALGADGAQLSVSQLRGHPVLLDFWATWCGPCRQQAPIVDRISRRWGDRGLVVVGVNTDTPDQGDPGEFARAHRLTYPIVRDPSGTASRAYDVDSLPTLVVLSSAGKVVAVRTGVTYDDELDDLISKAL
jgi:cytochrome c biogenesis protein CcmG, thiol:disulfide interchange protein DsbE